MEIHDLNTWYSLGKYLSEHYEELNIRSLANYIYALYKASSKQPIMLDFSDLFQDMELELIKRMDMADTQSMNTVVLSYAKS